MIPITAGVLGAIGLGTIPFVINESPPSSARYLRERGVTYWLVSPDCIDEIACMVCDTPDFTFDEGAGGMLTIAAGNWCGPLLNPRIDWSRFLTTGCGDQALILDEAQQVQNFTWYGPVK